MNLCVLQNGTRHLEEAHWVEAQITSPSPADITRPVTVGIPPPGFPAAHKPVTLSGNVVPVQVGSSRTRVVLALTGTSSGKGAPHPNGSQRAQPSGRSSRPCTQTGLPRASEAVVGGGERQSCLQGAPSLRKKSSR